MRFLRSVKGYTRLDKIRSEVTRKELEISGIQDVNSVHNVLKDVMYRRKVRDLADLRQPIIEALELITPHMLINTWQELEYRLCICRATTGSHIEVY